MLDISIMFIISNTNVLILHSFDSILLRTLAHKGVSNYSITTNIISSTSVTETDNLKSGCRNTKQGETYTGTVSSTAHVNTG